MTTYERRFKNPGRRERAARKARRRTWVVVEGNSTISANHTFFAKYHAEAEPLKLGTKHRTRFILRSHLTVANAEKSAVGAPWSPLVGPADVSAAA